MIKYFDKNLCWPGRACFPFVSLSQHLFRLCLFFLLRISFIWENSSLHAGMQTTNNDSVKKNKQIRWYSYGTGSNESHDGAWNCGQLRLRLLQHRAAGDRPASGRSEQLRHYYEQQHENDDVDGPGRPRFAGPLPVGITAGPITRGRRGSPPG